MQYACAGRSRPKRLADDGARGWRKLPVELRNWVWKRHLALRSALVSGMVKREEQLHWAMIGGPICNLAEKTRDWSVQLENQKTRGARGRSRLRKSLHDGDRRS